MSQEHRFCAEIYARLFPIIDQSKRIVVNPDGEANIPGWPNNLGAPPDLCFTLAGQDHELRIEAKILKQKNDKYKAIHLEDSQKAWCQSPTPAGAPHLWIVSTRELDECWMFTHQQIAAGIERQQGNSAPLNLWPNGNRPQGSNVTELAMQIITWSAENPERRK